ncbi:MAG: hypothetical protein K2H50_03280 [Paramuribaculum sp.]|nr:hypothetical protein [Barnesiella sp.]MDE5822595.1 hypothetical protein [Paramuribaculum sp.]MDE5836012.1 hypothetical protein [Paramuribaculum sp.]
MADTLKQKLDRIEGKASLLAKKIAELKQSRNASVSRINELEQIELRQKKEIQSLDTQVQYLSLSHTIAPKTEDIANSRDILAHLVREIDRCIADIGY